MPAHVLVVGSGIAGLITAARVAHSCDVTLVTKDALGEANTRYAQGGIAGALAPDDTVSSHVEDTLLAGAGLCDPDAVRVLCSEGPDRIRELAELGVPFDRDGDDWARGLEGAHSVPRILHAGGDATGRAISDALIQHLSAQDVQVLEHTMLIDLVQEGSRVIGADVLVERPATAPRGVQRIAADAVVIATGGAGHLYPYTTNPAGATGDGVAAALRAGATVRDGEFYQFHPTALAVPGSFLVSEAVRGHGAVLRDQNGDRFMPTIDPRAELAPRDIVALGIARTMAAQNGMPVWLDATGVSHLQRHFPTIDRAVRDAGFNWTRTSIPVTPAAHYWMGGIATDLSGRTGIPGLWAVGEAAHTGVHGANRLASNSLLEGAVFAARAAASLTTDILLQRAAPSRREDGQAGAAARSSSALTPASGASSLGDSSSGASSSWASSPVGDPRQSLRGTADSPGFRSALQELMWHTVGLERSSDGLDRAVDVLDSWASDSWTPDVAALDAAALDAGASDTTAGSAASAQTDAAAAAAESRRRLEDRNLLLLARVIARQARARAESRGAHSRLDHPTTDPALAHSLEAGRPLTEAFAC